MAADNNRRPAWQRFTAEAELRTAGHIRMTPAPGERGTEVRLQVEAQSGGVLAESVDWMHGSGSNRCVRVVLRPWIVCCVQV